MQMLDAGGSPLDAALDCCQEDIQFDYPKTLVLQKKQVA
jgi:hypothetical protein